MPEAYLPFEIQSEIIKRVLPVKSLLRFRSVSKQWKSLIDSSEFITDHCVNHAHQHHLLVRYEVDSDEYKYVSIVDDDDTCFPQHKLSPIVPPTVNLVKRALILDSSHGLVCLYGDDPLNRRQMIVVWNLSIRKSVGIVVPDGLTIVGVGVCPKTRDPKIVTIKFQNVTPKVEVFTLSSGTWRSIPMNIHFPCTTRFKSHQVVIDGVIYWVTSDFLNEYCSRIISFDLVTEEFGEVDHPDGLACGNLDISPPRRIKSIWKLNKSLAVFNIDDDYRITSDVWKMMKNGFEKVSTVSLNAYDIYDIYNIVGYRINGQPIREQPFGEYGSLRISLEAYEPSTKHISDLGIHVDIDSAPFLVTSYTESLLLLNNPSDYIVQG